MQFLSGIAVETPFVDGDSARTSGITEVNATEFKSSSRRVRATKKSSAAPSWPRVVPGAIDVTAREAG